jgi:hypothetical protein
MNRLNFYGSVYAANFIYLLILKPKTENMENSKPEVKLTTEQKIKAVSVLIVVFVFVWIFFIPSCDNGKKEQVKKTYSKFEALYESRQFVLKQLKAPSTADFCQETDNVKQVNDTTFVVVSCVDSQNSFGAMLRSSYTCKIIFLPSSDKVQINDLVIK